MKDSSELAELQDILRLEKGLQDVTGSINGAQNIREILINARPLIIDLFQAEAAHIYVVNNKNKREIMTLLQSDGQIKERKTLVSNETIPGYVSNTGRMINISDFSNNLQINQYSDLLLDSNRDSRFGVVVRQILAMPIVYGGEVMGAVEVINKKNEDGPFRDEEPVLLQEISEALGVAIYNQLRLDPKTKRTKFGYLVSNNLINEEDLNRANNESKEKKESLEEILMKQYKIT